MPPKKWVVACMPARLSRYRRPAKDYERLTENGMAHLYIASIQLRVRRLARLRAERRATEAATAMAQAA